jgi:2-polyprenyl-6-methoxyphenol hydroxylase-like FAD-dependent oxidoreductase
LHFVCDSRTIASFMQHSRNVPVIVVGGGPTGLAMAIELDRHGVGSLLVERHETTRQHPRASVVNARSTELCRYWGIADEVMAEAMVPSPSLGVTWTTRLADREIGRLVVIEDLEKAMVEFAASPVLPADLSAGPLRADPAVPRRARGAG